MLHRLVAKSDGQLYLQEPVSVERDGIVFEFRPDETRRMAEVAVTVKVLQDQVPGYASTIGPGEGNSAATIRIGLNR